MVSFDMPSFEYRIQIGVAIRERKSIHPDMGSPRGEQQQTGKESRGGDVFSSGSA